MFNSSGKTSYVSESTLHIIFSSKNPPFLLTYDSFIGQHSIWIVREAKKEVYMHCTWEELQLCLLRLKSKLHIVHNYWHFTNPWNELNTFPSLIFLQTMFLKCLIFLQDYPEPTGSDDHLSSDSLPHPSPRFPTPILKSSTYSRLSVTGSPPSFLSQARTSSPSEKGPSRYPHSPYIPSPQVSRLHSGRTLLQSPGPHSLGRTGT